MSTRVDDLLRQAQREVTSENMAVVLATVALTEAVLEVAELLRGRALEEQKTPASSAPGPGEDRPICGWCDDFAAGTAEWQEGRIPSCGGVACGRVAFLPYS